MSLEQNHPERRVDRVRAALGRARRRAREADLDDRWVAAARRLRRALPGDPEFGDPLSMAGRDSAGVVARVADRLYGDEQRASREAGLAALQVWQTASRRLRRDGAGDEVTILFTDLVEFSAWAARAGDEAALRLLREVATAWETPVREHRGTVVKRLGDGLMAVLPAPSLGVAAVTDAWAALAAIEVEGYRPLARAGLHLGRPRTLGGDYLGVDVNVAARLCQEAGDGELLVSAAALDRLDLDTTDAAADHRFDWRAVKGVPEGLTAYTVRVAGS
ncbi:adenylate/guanylate cyclase domain-containing protein [Rhodococcus aerolatus]